MCHETETEQESSERFLETTSVRIYAEHLKAGIRPSDLMKEAKLHAIILHRGLRPQSKLPPRWEFLEDDAASLCHFTGLSAKVICVYSPDGKHTLWVGDRDYEFELYADDVWEVCHHLALGLSNLDKDKDLVGNLQRIAETLDDVGFTKGLRLGLVTPQ